MERIENILKNLEYPGRGIILGITPNAQSLVAAYFIMGRSSNSRNRVFEAEGKTIKIRAFDESKLADPSLVVYYPLKVCGNMMIVTNGDQTDTIHSFIRNGQSFEAALATRCYEPDPPLLTPRISGIMDLVDGSFKLSILKADGEDCVRYYYNYPPSAGKGRCIFTYNGDNTNPRSYEGEPLLVALEDDIDSFTKTIWDSLNEDNKVSLFVRYIDIKSKQLDTRILNMRG